MNKMVSDFGGGVFFVTKTNVAKNQGAWDGLCYFIVALPEPSI